LINSIVVQADFGRTGRDVGRNVLIVLSGLHTD
jgi:hypothetical protein